MEFKHKRQQWAVGHGFFHTASIEIDGTIYRYVYDCGGKTQKIVEAEIDRYKTNEDLDERDEPLDMLVISHFHRDHINGIPYLLKNFKIKKLVIPYLSDDVKIIILAYLALISIEEWETFSGLVIDPDGWLRNLGSEDVQVIQVSDDEGEVVSEESLLPENGDGLGIGKGRINHASLGFIFKNRNAVWRFKFYVKNNPSLAQSVINSIMSTFNISSETDLLRNLQDEKWISIEYPKLKKCIQTVVTSQRQNSTNLSMFSGAIDPYVFCSHSHPSCTLSACHCFRRPRMGWLGTGDAELKGRNAFHAFEQSFKPFLDTIDTVTVPHHGSRSDYNGKIANLGLRHIITSDYENDPKDEHPASEVLLNLRINSPSVQIVTTNQCTAIFDFFSGVLD